MSLGFEPTIYWAHFREEMERLNRPTAPMQRSPQGAPVWSRQYDELAIDGCPAWARDLEIGTWSCRWLPEECSVHMGQLRPRRVRTVLQQKSCPTRPPVQKVPSH
ncbi:hypothetical protein MRX96_055309 [Rhipicephalus microplus]